MLLRSLGILAIALAVAGSHAAYGQNYPSKPIRMVTAEAGGGNDFGARLTAQELTGVFGQQVIVDNRGGGVLAGEVVSKSPPDGYTLLFYGAALWIGPFLRKSTPYDPLKDFAPITLAISTPNVLVVNPALPVASVKDLIAYGKARSGELNYATGSPGSSTHLAAELFKAMTGVNIVRIPYKGTGPGLTALIGGELQLMFPAAGRVVTQHIKSGKLRALAVTSAKPSALTPGLPTVAASGLTGFECASLVGVFAPAKTPAPLIHRLNQEFVRVLHQSDITERFFNASAETIGSSPEELTAKMKSEMAKWGKVIKDAGIHAD